MEMQIVEATRWLQSPFFDAFFKVVSWFGTELFFLMVFTLIYWAYKREFALRFGLFYLMSYCLNALLKLVVPRTRPNGGEHSFPSGHSQSFSMQASMITHEVFKSETLSNRKKIAILCDFIIAWIVIAYSRLYLNFHFLTDVLGGLLIALLMTMVLTYIWSVIPRKFKTLKVKHIIMYVTIGLGVVLILAFSLSQTILQKMLTDENWLIVYEMTGAVVGVCVGDLLNDRFISYDPSVDKVSVKVVKCLLGMGILAVYYYFIVIKFANRLIFALPIAFMIMMFLATFVFPLVFKKWTKEDQRIKEFESNN